MGSFNNQNSITVHKCVNDVLFTLFFNAVIENGRACCHLKEKKKVDLVGLKLREMERYHKKIR